MSDVTPVTSQETLFTSTRQWGKLISGETGRESLGPTKDMYWDGELIRNWVNWGKMIWMVGKEQISGL